MKSLLFIATLAIASPSFAYLTYAPNEHLIQEVESHPYRLLPRSDRFALAVDADFFKPAFFDANSLNNYKYDFYHGNGYYLVTRAEYKPVQALTLNLKLITTHGTSSNGPTYLALIVPQLGVTLEENMLGFDVVARLSDVNRQTLGAGLFVEQKETDGGTVELRRDEFRYKLMVDGTGSYRLDGGLIAMDANLWNGLAGVTVHFNEDEPFMQPPLFMGTAYSRHEWSNGLGYGVEAGGHSDAWAALAYVQYSGAIDQFHFWVKPQVRHYGSSIMGRLPKHVNHNFVSYEQNDKPFTSFMDIMAYGDDVNTISAQVNLEYVFNSFWRYYAETEALYYDYRFVGDYKRFFYRTGVKLYPFSGREDAIGILIGNKYLNASTGTADRTYSPPNVPDLENKPLFYQQFYYMFDFTTKF